MHGFGQFGGFAATGAYFQIELFQLVIRHQIDGPYALARRLQLVQLRRCVRRRQVFGRLEIMCLRQVLRRTGEAFGCNPHHFHAAQVLAVRTRRRPGPFFPRCRQCLVGVAQGGFDPLQRFRRVFQGSFAAFQSVSRSDAPAVQLGDIGIQRLGPVSDGRQLLGCGLASARQGDLAFLRLALAAFMRADIGLQSGAAFARAGDRLVERGQIRLVGPQLLPQRFPRGVQLCGARAQRLIVRQILQRGAGLPQLFVRLDLAVGIGREALLQIGGQAFAAFDAAIQTVFFPLGLTHRLLCGAQAIAGLGDGRIDALPLFGH